VVMLGQHLSLEMRNVVDGMSVGHRVFEYHTQLLTKHLNLDAQATVTASTQIDLPYKPPANRVLTSFDSSLAASLLHSPLCTAASVIHGGNLSILQT